MDNDEKSAFDAFQKIIDFSKKLEQAMNLKKERSPTSLDGNISKTPRRDSFVTGVCIPSTSLTVSRVDGMIAIIQQVRGGDEQTVLVDRSHVEELIHFIREICTEIDEIKHSQP